MDDLRERLKRRGEPAAGPGNAFSLRKALDRLALGERCEEKRGSSRRGRPLSDVIGGCEVTTDAGSCLEIASQYDIDHCHGRRPLREFMDADLGVVDFFCAGCETKPSVHPEEVVFVDLETTGLSVGPGTYAFLVGIGFLKGGHFRLKQLFLRDFSEEGAMMARVAEILGSFRILVSYNGKRFDVPVLEARALMSGQSGGGIRMRQWDLLYAARRLWRGKQADCRLETVERLRLGLERGVGDISGERIPETFFRYVHEGHTEGLDRILWHNAMDVLTLAMLCAHLAECLERLDPVRGDLVAVGRFFEKRGCVERSRACFEMVAGNAGDGGEKERGMFFLARQLKRERRMEEAVGLWKELVQRGGFGFVASCEEVAKYLEHNCRKPLEAADIVRHALERLPRAESWKREGLEKRLARLLRKGS